MPLSVIALTSRHRVLSILPTKVCQCPPLLPITVLVPGQPLLLSPSSGPQPGSPFSRLQAPARNFSKTPSSSESLSVLLPALPKDSSNLCRVECTHLSPEVRAARILSVHLSNQMSSNASWPIYSCLNSRLWATFSASPQPAHDPSGSFKPKSHSLPFVWRLLICIRSHALRVYGSEERTVSYSAWLPTASGSWSSHVSGM